MKLKCFLNDNEKVCYYHHAFIKQIINLLESISCGRLQHVVGSPAAHNRHRHISPSEMLQPAAMRS